MLIYLFLGEGEGAILLDVVHVEKRAGRGGKEAKVGVASTIQAGW